MNLCVDVCESHLQGLAPLKTTASDQQKSEASAQPKSLGSVYTNVAGKVSYFECMNSL